MDDTFLWTAATLFGIAILGASAGAVFYSTDASFGTLDLILLLFTDAFVAAGMSAQIHRRGLTGATLVGGLAGALGVLFFFSIPIGLAAATGAPMDAAAIAVLLLVAPGIAGGISASGTLYLAWGVDRYRARHGLVHAPRSVTLRSPTEGVQASNDDRRA